MPSQSPSLSSPRDAMGALLRLYAEWGVDCAVDETPHDRAVTGRPTDAPSADPAPDAPSRPTQVSGRQAPNGPPGTHAAPLPRGPATVAPDSISTAANLPDLIARLETLPDMPLRRTATHTLAPVAVPGAALMILGDIPDSDEDRTGVLFAGPSSALLARMLGSIGLSPDALSRAAAIPWRPPGGRDATEAERRTCIAPLHRAIVLCAPKIVASFGATPARMLMGPDTQLNRVRGRWTTLDLPDAPHPIRLLPMRHPAQVAASPQARKDAWRDLILLAEALDAEMPPAP